MATAAGAVAISGIAVWDEVLTYHEATGELGSYAVTATHEHDDPVLIHLTVDPDLLDEQPGEVIVTTPEHPFWVLGTWIDAGELTVGMPLSRATDDGTLAASGTVTGVERVEQVRTMYDLTVAEAHTFFVGEGAWLVHNSGCDPTELVRVLEQRFGAATVHGLRRHGAGTTLEQQRFRARTGYTPDGVSGRPVGATRVLDNQYLLEAYERALQEWQRNPMPFVDVPFRTDVAEGFYLGGRRYARTDTIRVQFSADGRVLTGYGLLP